MTIKPDIFQCYSCDRHCQLKMEPFGCYKDEPPEVCVCDSTIFVQWHKEVKNEVPSL